MITQSPSPSLARWNTAGKDRPALVCIPWAGAGAAPFRSWGTTLAEVATVYGVRLPGRESRFGEPLARRLPDIVDELARDVQVLPHASAAVFGHCSGALIAFELARALGSNPAPALTRLFVASQLAPCDVAARLAETSTRELRSAERHVVETLGESPELVELMLPIIAADMDAVASFAYAPATRLSVEITVFVGSRDVAVRPSDAAGWRAETDGRVEVREVAGADHLFSGEAWQALGEEIREALA